MSAVKGQRGDAVTSSIIRVLGIRAPRVHLLAVMGLSAFIAVVMVKAPPNTAREEQQAFLTSQLSVNVPVDAFPTFTVMPILPVEAEISPPELSWIDLDVNKGDSQITGVQDSVRVVGVGATVRADNEGTTGCPCYG